MPYAHIRKKIPRAYDRRVKLTDQDRAEIVRLYKQEKLPIREIARKYEGKTSRRNIQFIIFPERRKDNVKKRNERGGSKQYYDKDKWREEQKAHRRYKQKLHKRGLLEE